jgi:transposase InsO family protein
LSSSAKKWRTWGYLTDYQRALSITRKRWHTWLRRKEKDYQLIAQIEHIYEESHRVVGQNRLLRELRSRGGACSLPRLRRLLRDSGIKAWGVSRQAKRRKSTAPPNYLRSPFRVTGPNRVWVGDMTFVRTKVGFLHLSILLDLYSRRVVGWALGERQNTELALSALGMALLQRLPHPGLIHHTDRGTAYTSAPYQACLRNNGIVCSMSRAYRPWQNVFAERFFKSFKHEFANHTYFATDEIAKSAIFEYIEIFYNRQRRHKSLDNISPMEFEERGGYSFVTF